MRILLITAPLSHQFANWCQLSRGESLGCAAAAGRESENKAIRQIPICTGNDTERVREPTMTIVLCTK